MRLVHVMLVLLVLVGGYAASQAQPAEAPAYRPLTGPAAEALRAADKQASEPGIIERSIFGELTRNLSWVPGVLLFLGALIKRDRGAWWFAFLAAVATFVIFGASAFIDHFGPWLKEPVGMIVGTLVVLSLTFGMFVVHQKRLDIFARTEITFGVIGIGYSLQKIDEAGGWAGLILSIYGLVEGFTRLREADGPDSVLAVFDGATSSR